MTLPLFLLSLFSIASILLPLSLAIVYSKKRGIFFDQRINLVVAYIIVITLLHGIMTFLAFNSINNLFLMRTINYVDLFFLGLFLVSFYSRSKLIRFAIIFLLFGIVFLIDLYLGLSSTSPNEQATVVSIILIWLVILVSKKINYSDERGKTYSYFLLAIAVGAINNLSIIVSDILPQLFVFIIAIANIACYILYSIGFYILIKKTKPSNSPLKQKTRSS